jgi:hypothetical protein
VVQPGGGVKKLERLGNEHSDSYGSFWEAKCPVGCEYVTFRHGPHYFDPVTYSRETYWPDGSKLGPRGQGGGEGAPANSTRYVLETVHGEPTYVLGEDDAAVAPV